MIGTWMRYHLHSKGLAMITLNEVSNRPADPLLEGLCATKAAQHSLMLLQLHPRRIKATLHRSASRGATLAAVALHSIPSGRRRSVNLAAPWSCVPARNLPTAVNT